MPHKVKCLYCEKIFDRDLEPYVQIGRRYAHPQCAEEHEKNMTQEERDLETLENYIKELFNEPYINAKIKNQIKSYHDKYQFSYSGMLKTLIYWFDVKGNSVEQANDGIGIIPYVYKQAHDYYYELYLAQTANKNKDIEKYKKPQTKVVTIPPPAIPKKKPKLFFERED